MNKYYETQLPEGYTERYTIDATEKKTGIILNVAATVIMVVLIILSILIIRPTGTIKFYHYALVLLGLCAYMVLHELLHGAAYKLLTHQKLTFGLSLSCAFCGVPDIYVYRKTALVALLTPFVVFSVIFLGAAALMTNSMNQLCILFLFSIHFGGCCGDLYVTYLYLFRMKDREILMRDTGPKQTFYMK